MFSTTPRPPETTGVSTSIILIIEKERDRSTKVFVLLSDDINTNTI